MAGSWMTTPQMTAPEMAASCMAAPQMAPSWMAARQMAVSQMVAYFEQEQVKKTNYKTLVGETGCLCNFCFLLFGHCFMSLGLHPGFSDL